MRPPERHGEQRKSSSEDVAFNESEKHDMSLNATTQQGHEKK